MPTNADDYLRGPATITRRQHESQEHFVKRVIAFDEVWFQHPALTKREYFAAQILASLHAPVVDHSDLQIEYAGRLSRTAVFYADALIKELNK